MNLEILSFSDVFKFVPDKNSYEIQILTEFREGLIYNREKEGFWIESKQYYFDDIWPKEWNEHFWYNSKCEDFQKYLKEQQEKYPKMTEESLLGYLESQGHPYGRFNLFDESLANKILTDFEKVKNNVEQIIISSSDGKHRPAGLAIAMNQIYSWGIKGLTEKYFDYRKFVYQTMVDAAKKR